MSDEYFCDTCGAADEPLIPYEDYRGIYRRGCEDEHACQRRHARLPRDYRRQLELAVLCRG